MHRRPNRRTTLKSIGIAGLSASLVPNLFASLRFNKEIRFGMIADLHGGLAIDAEARLDKFLNVMAQQEVDALVQMGDFAFPNQKHQIFADKFNAAHQNTIHVIGNHEFDFGLKRKDCFKAWSTNAAYYRKDVLGLRILVLDGNEKGSPSHKTGYPSYIGNQQQEWLCDELHKSESPVLILSHQPLAGQSAIDNALEIQELLTNFKEKILLCINGHSHVDSLLQVDGVNYLHLNSASYYWVGGQKRMAYYQESLFTTLTIDLASAEIKLLGMSTQWKPGDSPQKLKYFDRDSAPPETIVTPQIRKRTILARNQIDTLAGQSGSTDESCDNLKVMTWNIWGRLNQAPRYSIDNKTARQRTIEIIQESGADIVAMIETYGSASEIAKSLEFHHYTPSKDANLCILSRYPLTDVGTPTGLSAFSFIAATATLPGGQQVRIYDVWLTSSGRHIVKIKDSSVSDQEFCAGDEVRFEMLNTLLKHDDFKNDLAKSNNVPVIVAGDFNCVSHLDHTSATRHGKLNQERILPVKVSKSMYQAGFLDSYRESNPDLLNSTLGHTWTTVGMGFAYQSDEGFVPVAENTEPEYRDPYARIDYIYSTGTKLRIRKSRVIAHHHSNRNRSFPEFPSDHAAVMTDFSIQK